MYTKRENIYYGIIGTIGIITLLYFSFFTHEHKEFIPKLFLLLLIGSVILEKLNITINQFRLTLDTSLVLAGYFIMGLTPALWITTLTLFISDTFINLRPKRKTYASVGMFILMFTVSHIIYKIIGFKITLNSITGIILSAGFGILVFLFNWLFLYLQFIISFKGKLPEEMGESFIWDLYGNLIIIPLSILVSISYMGSGYLGLIILLVLVISSNLLFRLLRHLVYMNNELRVVHQVAVSISSRLDIKETTYNILQGINELVDSDYCAILEFNKKNLQFKTTDYICKDEINFDKYLIDKYLNRNINKLIECRNSFIIEDAKKSKFFNETTEEVMDILNFTGSLIYEPLILEKDLIGCLVIISRIRNKFSKDHLYILDILSNQAVIAIENARLYKDVHSRAIKDGLTGLYNQRYFYEILDSITNKCFNCQRENCVYCNRTSLIIFDLDYFKLINDIYGHQTGDKVLKEISDIIKSNVRKGDFVARYGGEEFTVILPNTSQENAFEIAERIRRAIEGNTFYSLNGDKIKVTVSGGVSEFPLTADSGTKLLSYADRAMYNGSKKQGRNKISIYVN